jgi:hypothetical protein
MKWRQRKMEILSLVIIIVLICICSYMAYRIYVSNKMIKAYKELTESDRKLIVAQDALIEGQRKNIDILEQICGIKEIKTEEA